MSSRLSILRIIYLFDSLPFLFFFCSSSFGGLRLRADWFKLRFVSSIKRPLVIIRQFVHCTHSAQLINHNYKLLMALNWDYNLRCVPLYLLNENGQVEGEEMRIIGRLREISWESSSVTYQQRVSREKEEDRNGSDPLSTCFRLLIR